jgi:hypothetical protein
MSKYPRISASPSRIIARRSFTTSNSITTAYLAQKKWVTATISFLVHARKHAYRPHQGLGAIFVLKLSGKKAVGVRFGAVATEGHPVDLRGRRSEMCDVVPAVVALRQYL